MEKRLIIINLEDSTMDYELNREALDQEGIACDLFRVETREDFIEAIEQRKPDLILADYCLPNYDGISALEWVQKRCPDVPFIFVSGSMGEEAAIETLKNGAMDYVLKDRLKRLGTAVRRALMEKAEKTQKKWLQDAIRESEERYRTILDEMEEGYYEVDLKGNFTFVNDSEARLLGYSREELMGRNYRLITQPEQYPEIFKIYNRIYQAKKIIKNVAITHIRKDGTPLFVENSISPMWDSHRKITGFRGISQDITDRKKKENQILASLKEKEILLREIHHRVKNNLQVVQSLLNLQAGKMNDLQAREAFKESRDRIRSMALIHEKLYQSSDLASINMGDYLRNLGNRAFHSSPVFSDRVRLKVEAGELQMGIDKAIPVGLIVNELVSNSLKHAFPFLKTEESAEKRKGELLIQLSKEEGTFFLRVADNGVGVPKEWDLMEGDSLGLQLVAALVEQLEGTIDVHREKGTEFRITFPEV